MFASLQRCKYSFKVAGGICFVVTKTIRWNSTLRAGTILATHTKELFRIVTDEACKDGMASVDISISKAHLNPINSSSFERLGNLADTGMIEIRDGAVLTSCVVNVFKFCCREVCKENLSTM